MTKVSREDALTIVLKTAADADAAKALLKSFGYAIVPTEPTDAMIYEGGGWWYATLKNYKTQNENAALIYRAMIASAAPESAERWSACRLPWRQTGRMMTLRRQARRAADGHRKS